MRRRIIITVMAAALALVSTVQAEQGGNGHYVSGATASFIDALPGKPGWVFGNLFMNYNDATFDATHGLPLGGSIALNVTANAYAEIPLVMYTPDVRILGGLPSFAVAVPYMWVDVKASATIDRDGVTHAVSRSDFANGIGDILFWPLMLGWTNQDMKYDVRCCVYAPSGEYNQGSLANPGLGYWTFDPAVTFSWLSSKIGTEVSVFTGLAFNTKNTDADYQSGNIFHIDSTVAQHLPLFGGFAGVGANGFYYQQITGDSGAGARLGSFKTQSYGVGPTLSYIHQFNKVDLAFEAKWLPQLNVQNTTKGDYIWVKVMLIF